MTVDLFFIIRDSTSSVLVYWVQLNSSSWHTYKCQRSHQRCMKLSARSRDYSEAFQLSQEADAVACEGCTVMGCCKTCKESKANRRRGLWSPEEDQRLREYVLKHGHGSWSSLPAKAGKRLLLLVWMRALLPNAAYRHLQYMFWLRIHAS